MKLIVGLITSAGFIFYSISPAIAADFMDYPCTVDCSGHEAGYAWAEENEILNPDDCEGNSQSFIEGCQAYAQSQESPDDMEETNQDDESEDGSGN